MLLSFPVLGGSRRCIRYFRVAASQDFGSRFDCWASARDLGSRKLRYLQFADSGPLSAAPSPAAQLQRVDIGMGGSPHRSLRGGEFTFGFLCELLDGDSVAFSAEVYPTIENTMATGTRGRDPEILGPLPSAELLWSLSASGN